MSGNGEDTRLQEYRKWLVDTGQFTRQVMITDGDIKVAVAKAVARHVDGDADIALEESHSTFWRDVQMVRAGRTRTVHGHYHRHAGKAEMFLVQKGGEYVERVAGGVYQHAQVEAESIVGGAYSANFVGGYMRIAAFADFMAWGGWAEADAVRMELSSVAIRSYMGYAHAVGARYVFAIHLIDDWIQRNEAFATLVDSYSEAITTGGPGAYTENAV